MMAWLTSLGAATLAQSQATPGAWVHDLSPFIFRVSDTLGLRWYGMAYVAGFVLGYFLARRVLKVGRSPFDPARLGDFVIWCAVGAVVGGRLGYVLLYDRSLLGPVDGFPFWGVLAMHQGGMASHGGIAGACVAAAWFSLRQKAPPLHGIDLLAYGAPIGISFGRLANFINGELYGRVVAPPGEPGPSWAVRFPTELEAFDADRLPSLIGPRVVDAVAQAGGDPQRYVAAYADLSSANEATRDAAWRYISDAMASLGDVLRDGAADPAQQEALRSLMLDLLPARHPSQLYAAALEGWLVCLVVVWLWRKPRKPGVIAGAFGVAYAVGRIANEFFRRPDAALLDDEFAWTAEHLGVGITRGQWLSLGILAAAAAMWWWAAKRSGEPLGGWRRGPWTPPEAGSPRKADSADGASQAAAADGKPGLHSREGKKK
ncbi:MAG: prolipoprotein diacylglyceryl transferase [Planctomycetota bacterium]